MSVRLYRLFVGSLRQNLPRYSLPGNQVRSLTAMDVATTSAKEAKEKDSTVPSKGSTRYKKRFMKRQWEDGGRKEDGATESKKSCDGSVERIKRKKMAVLLGYCGVDYYGMQRNPGVCTIEEELLKAMWDAKYITEEDYNNQQNVHFQRSSRTDKGVSATRQVVSLKLPLEVDIEEINKRLPECIRVFAIKRVTNKFDSKIKCNARSYSYTLPTYVFETSVVSDEEKKAYRIPPEKLEQISQVLGVYKGTKSYHNFTERKNHTDPSASRYMMAFDVDKVFVESDMEFAVLIVKGQSFMLHQIRKMVALAISVVRGHTDISTLEKAFGKDKVMIPTAPGLGLVLDKVHYDRYNIKFHESHASLNWQEEEEAVQAFKCKYIHPVIVKGEIEGNSMGAWLEKLSNHSYEPSDDVPVDKEAEAAGDDDERDSDANGEASLINPTASSAKNSEDESDTSESESAPIEDETEAYEGAQIPDEAPIIEEKEIDSSASNAGAEIPEDTHISANKEAEDIDSSASNVEEPVTVIIDSSNDGDEQETESYDGDEKCLSARNGDVTPPDDTNASANGGDLHLEDEANSSINKSPI